MNLHDEMVSVDDIVAAIITAGRRREIIAADRTAYITIGLRNDWYLVGAGPDGWTRHRVSWGKTVSDGIVVHFHETLDNV